MYSNSQQRTSLSPGSATRSPDAKKMKKEEDDGDKSDQDLVVDDNGNDANGTKSPKENGNQNGNGGDSKKGDPLSPSSQRSTPASLKGGKDMASAAAADKSSASPGAKISPPVTKAALAGIGNEIA